MQCEFMDVADLDTLITGVNLCQKKAYIVLTDLMEEYHFNQVADSLNEIDWQYNRSSHDVISMKLQILFDYLYKLETGAGKLRETFDRLFASELEPEPGADHGTPKTVA